MVNFMPRSQWQWHLTVGTAIIATVTVMAAIILWLLQLVVSQLTIRHFLRVVSDWLAAAAAVMIVSKHRNIWRHLSEKVQMISRLVNKGAIMFTALLQSVQSDESRWRTFYLGVEGSFPHFYYPTFLRITRKKTVWGGKKVLFLEENSLLLMVQTACASFLSFPLLCLKAF